MTAKIVMVTGISGSGSRGFCEAYNQYGNGHSKRIKVYHTGDMMRTIAEDALEREIRPENFLSLASDTLDTARYSAFKEIAYNLERDKQDYDRIIVDTHMWFSWNKLWQKAFNWDLLNKIQPDMFVTMIDMPSTVKKRQMQTPMGRMQEKRSLSDILSWMQLEAETTRAAAELYRKPHYVFSPKQNPEAVESLFDNSILFYASFPMTDANEETTRRINEFKTELRNLRKKVLNDPRALEIPLLDPAQIEVMTGEKLSGEDEDADKRHTIWRDLECFVKKATHTISLYPNAETDLSAGVTDEHTYALRTGRDSYVISPRVRRSPFLDKNSTYFFSNEKEFMAFFEKKIIEDLERFRRR